MSNLKTSRLAALWAALCLAFAGAAAAAEIPVVELEGIVQPVSARHVVQGLERAEEIHAPIVILRLDTPGGLDTSMREIIDKMLNCKVPVVAFVGPSGARAASAGFLITISADVAAMAPGTNMGAAHPVSALGGQMDEVMSKKVASDAAAYIRSKAERRGRNVEMAEQAVLESRSFTDQEALKLHLIDLVVKDIPGLLEALDGREVTRFDGTRVTLHLKGATTAAIEMPWREAFLSAIARPGIILLLLIGTLLGIGTEISHPGMIAPGVIGVVCLFFFLLATQIIPVNWAGVLLIVLAVGMFVAEVKVTSYGLLTVGGVIAMVLGAMMLIDSDLPELRIGLGMLVPLVIVTAAWTITLVSLVVRSRRRRATTGQEGMVGLVGEAETDVAAEGWVIVQGERWRAEAEEPVAAGERVVVTGLEGMTLRIRRKQP